MAPTTIAERCRGQVGERRITPLYETPPPAATTRRTGSNCALGPLKARRSASGPFAVPSGPRLRPQVFSLPPRHHGRPHSPFVKRELPRGRTSPYVTIVRVR